MSSPVEHCDISHPLISKLLATLNDMIRDSRIPDLWGKNWVETRVIPQGDTAKLALILEGVRNVDLEAEPGLRAVLDALTTIPAAVSVSYRTPSGAVEPFAGPSMVGVWRLWARQSGFRPARSFKRVWRCCRLPFHACAPWRQFRPMNPCLISIAG